MRTKPNGLKILNGRVTIVLLGCILPFLVACSQRVTDANLQEVKADMSTKEVESILGQPTKIEVPPEPESTEVVKTVHVTRYVYQQNGKKVVLRFVGDRLATNGVEGSFDKN